jgi:hypothetical protein
MRVSARQRLREMLASPLVVSDVRELDGLLEHLASRHGIPVAMLGANLAVKPGDEAGLLIGVTDRKGGLPLVQVVYRLAALG